MGADSLAENTQSHGQGTLHSAEMGAVVQPENTLNAPQIFGPICLPKPNSL